MSRFNGTPGNYLTRDRSYAQMLMQGAGSLNNGSHPGGIASMLQKGFAGYLMGRDQKNQEAANAAIANAITQPSGAHPGVARGVRPPSTTMGRLSSALAANSSNPYMANMAIPIAMQEKAREQQLADAKSRIPSFSTVKSPYGRGGVGQKNSITGAIANYQPPEKPSGNMDSDVIEIQQLQGILNKLPQSDPSRTAYQNRLQKISTGRPVAEITMGGEQRSAFDEALGKRQATQFSEREDKSLAAQSMMTQLDEMETLLNMGVQTGMGQEFINGARQFGAKFGFDVDWSQVRGGEGFSAISNQFIGPLVKSLGTNPTDKDLQFIVNSAPTLGKTPEGNRMIMAGTRRKLQRDVKLAELQNAYVQQNGNLNGFSKVSSEYFRQNPIFSGEERSSMYQLIRGGQASGLPQYGASKGDDGGFADRMKSYGAIPQGPELEDQSGGFLR